MSRSWKTTGAGIGAILTAVGAGLTAIANGTPVMQVLMTAGPAIMAGIGLLCARDNDKSSEDVGAK